MSNSNHSLESPVASLLVHIVIWHVQSEVYVDVFTSPEDAEYFIRNEIARESSENEYEISDEELASESLKDLISIYHEVCCDNCVELQTQKISLRHAVLENLLVNGLRGAEKSEF